MLFFSSSISTQNPLDIHKKKKQILGGRDWPSNTKAILQHHTTLQRKELPFKHPNRKSVVLLVHAQGSRGLINTEHLLCSLSNWIPDEDDTQLQLGTLLLRTNYLDWSIKVVFQRTQTHRRVLLLFLSHLYCNLWMRFEQLGFSWSWRCRNCIFLKWFHPWVKFLWVFPLNYKTL